MSLFNKKSPKKQTEVQLMKKVEQLVSEDPDLKYNGFFKDKNRNSVAVFIKKTDTEIEISLLDLYEKISVLQAEKSEDKAQINRLSVTSVNIGYGSLLMREFLYQCKIHGVKKIDGSFTFAKIKNEEKERALHFFAKHGFEIHFSNTENKAVIHFESE